MAQDRGERSAHDDHRAGALREAVDLSRRRLHPSGASPEQYRNDDHSTSIIKIRQRRPFPCGERACSAARGEQREPVARCSMKFDAHRIFPDVISTAYCMT
jgi:hypothetical protein